MFVCAPETSKPLILSFRNSYSMENACNNYSDTNTHTHTPATIAHANLQRIFIKCFAIDTQMLEFSHCVCWLLRQKMLFSSNKIAPHTICSTDRPDHDECSLVHIAFATIPVYGYGVLEARLHRTTWERSRAVGVINASFYFILFLCGKSDISVARQNPGQDARILVVYTL